jgi:single-stranded-DNA-specific exonuclease
MTTVAARPRPVPRWATTSAADPDRIAAIRSALALPPEVAALLVARGYADPAAARAFLRPRLAHLHAPRLMRGMDAAVDRLAQAIARGEPVLVHGDYDVDGICSTSLLVRTIRHLGGVAIPFIPHRLRDGYDLTQAGVRAATEAGATVLLTCDCGTTAHDAVAELSRLGVDVIISDHHLPGGDPPACHAILNPRIPGCDYPDRDLCAAGIAFKLAQALLDQHQASPNVAFNMLDMVALATVADVAPLRGENRVFVRYGLRLLAESRSIGLRALVAAAGLEGRELTAGRVAFLLAPRLNAVGRIGHAMRGVELLLSSDEGEANAIARELEELNRTRQAIDRETLDAARRQAETLDLDNTFGLVLAAEGWHPGVVGIVASRLVEELYRPVVLVAVEDGIGKGSGRSIPVFDLHAGLSACRPLLARFGGHRAAAGLTVRAERIPELAERFNAVAAERLTRDDLVPELRLDLELPFSGVTPELEGLLRHFEPHGIGNAAPVLVSRRVRVVGAPRIIGQTGLKLRLGEGTTQHEALWWSAAERLADFPYQTEVDVAYRLERDTYLDDERVCLRIADMRR